jgi:hypothetical protein
MFVRPNELCLDAPLKWYQTCGVPLDERYRCNFATGIGLIAVFQRCRKQSVDV